MKKEVIKIKEYLYIGHYEDTENNYILKVGTTKDLKRRRRQHNRLYPMVKNHPMKKGNLFIYSWYIKLSHKNTLKYEKEFKECMKISKAIYIPKDRFLFKKKPEKIYLTVQKTYEIKL